MRRLALSALVAASLLAPARAAERVVRPAEEARAHILEDGGPTHHHALHKLNPLVAKFQSFYPNVVHIIVDDTGEEYTVLNQGHGIEVAAGLYGKAYLIYEIETEAIEQVYEKVSGGMPGEGMPRLEVAGIMREWVSLSLDPPAEPSKKVPGPPLTKRAKQFHKIIKHTTSLLLNTGKASEAKAAGKKLATLYFGLQAKIALFMQGKAVEKLTKTLVKELGRDLDEGLMELQPGGWWSTFVDVFSFFQITRDPAASGYTGIITALKERVQGLLSYHKTLPGSGDIATRDEILQNRLELLEKMIEVNDL